MKSGIKFLLACAVSSLWLAACGPLTPVPPAPTGTPSATITSTPQPTATMTTPTVTNTVAPTQTPVFPVPTRQLYSWETPTPIATPQGKSSDFHLKVMDEAQSARLVAWMNEYSVTNYPALGDWLTDSEFEGSQQPVAMAIQEYLYRFPDSRDAEQYRWQLAFIHALSGEWFKGNQEDFDGWMIAAMQKELDNGNVGPENLEDFLGRYWFDVAVIQRVENLFGDGKTA